MLSADAPRRAGRRESRVGNPLVSLRSPLPLMAAALGVTVLVIALVTLPPRPIPATQDKVAALAEAEVLSVVAHEMRSGDAAARVISEGRVHFDDGTWTITVADAHFHFSQRNRIVVADDPSAIELQYRS
ncbi:MAG: hypothetical protein NVSMB2_19980 [Chloroflexota bacterium]